ncbi:unnamed protein product, partial [Didymodactylos carnosus]
MLRNSSSDEDDGQAPTISSNTSGRSPPSPIVQQKNQPVISGNHIAKHGGLVPPHTGDYGPLSPSTLPRTPNNVSTSYTQPLTRDGSNTFATQRTSPNLNSSGQESPSLANKLHSSQLTQSLQQPQTDDGSRTSAYDATSLKSNDSSLSDQQQPHPSSISNTRHPSTDSTMKYRIQQQQLQPSPLTNHIPNTASSSTTTSSGIPLDRIPSPSPSLISEREREENEKLERELEQKRKRIQIYVFVCRCISCPFNSKQSSDMARKHLKITQQQYTLIKDRFHAFLNGKTHIEADEAFSNAVRSYYEIFLKSERIVKMVQSGGCCSDDFRDVFKINIEKRVRSLPDIDSLKISKDTVVTLWMNKYDAIYRGQDQDQDNLNRRASKINYSSGSAELIMSKEQLYDMFQNILTIKKFEHQMIYNSAQLDNNDEQAATIRRELDGRMKQAESLQRQRGLLPRFVHKEMDSLFVDELKKTINDLMSNLESLPVRGGAEQKPLRPKRGTHGRNGSGGGGSNSSGAHSSSNKSLLVDGGDSEAEPGLSKLAFVLNFNINITVKEVKGLKSVPTNRVVYCTMTVEGGETYRTEHAEAGKPVWESLAEFPTNQILPIVKVKLYMENYSILHLEDIKLGKVTLQIDPTFNKTNWWTDMIKSKSTATDDLKVKLDVRMEKPQNLKMCGWCYARGKNVWKSWKKRYYALVQVSQYCFAMCSYREKKSEPTEMMPLEGYTVDYAAPDQGLVLDDAKYFFKAVREGDIVTFATNEENERHGWVQALYRATGQSHKPIPPQTTKQQQTGQTANKDTTDSDRTEKLGFDEYIQSDPCKFDHHDLFKYLQTSTLDFRLNDPYCSLGWLSPGQSYVLEEYCARYGVRHCLRHLYYLSDLLDRAEQNFMIDPQLLHYSYVYCASHVSGNGQDSNIATISVEEKDRFNDIKERLRQFLEQQVTNFRYT